MKKTGILNSHISKLFSDLGHTDKIVIADVGLPIPEGVQRIDISLKKGVPSFPEVLSTVLDDLVVEKVIVAEEVKHHNVAIYEDIKLQFSDIEIEYVKHETFKTLTRDAKAVIRTGESTPYANCILQSDVFFNDKHNNK